MHFEIYSQGALTLYQKNILSIMYSKNNTLIAAAWKNFLTLSQECVGIINT